VKAPHRDVPITPIKGLRSFIAPGGLLLLGALVLLWPGTLPRAFAPALQAFPYLVFGVGLFLGWYFHRGRIVFITLVLAAADWALELALGGSGRAATRTIVFQSVALLLPLNLAVYGSVAERGILNKRTLLLLAPLPLQGLAVWELCLAGLKGPAAWLSSRVVGWSVSQWTPLTQPALLAFALALGLQIMRWGRTRHPMEGAVLWAMVAAVVALQGTRFGWDPSQFLATAGLILVVGLLQTSYRMAYHDELTGLPGRRALNEALLRQGSRYAVALVDIDHFKKFNDTYGHDVGDQVLRMVASKLAQVSGGGEAFRYGGEEFCVLFPGGSVQDARVHLEALRKTVEGSGFVLRGRGRPRKKPSNPAPARGPRREVTVTISIGVAERNGRHADPNQVIKAADQALYRAKEEGRNRVCT
jgi:diguanylate cyclase (GGDEF)-like protein